MWRKLDDAGFQHFTALLVGDLLLQRRLATGSGEGVLNADHLERNLEPSVVMLKPWQIVEGVGEGIVHVLVAQVLHCLLFC